MIIQFLKLSFDDYTNMKTFFSDISIENFSLVIQSGILQGCEFNFSILWKQKQEHSKALRQNLHKNTSNIYPF
jgi:hypothetical protein